MPEFLYRFRPLERLLDDNELEHQTIFFAAPSTLNDPLEGYLDIFWQGDSIVWRNLFKNYLLCLDHVHTLAMIGGNKIHLNSDDIQVFLSYDNLPTQQYKDRVSNLFSIVLSAEPIAKLINTLGSLGRVVRRDELCFYLSLYHKEALSAILSFDEQGASPERKLKIQKLRQALSTSLKDNFYNAVTSISDSEADIVFQIGESMQNQMGLIRIYNNIPLSEDDNRRFILFDFPRLYIEQLERLIYPPWYAACFFENIENSALWGHYG